MSHTSPTKALLPRELSDLLLLPLVDVGVLDVALRVRVALLGDLRAGDDRGDVPLEDLLRDVAVGRAIDRKIARSER